MKRAQVGTVWRRIADVQTARDVAGVAAPLPGGADLQQRYRVNECWNLISRIAEDAVTAEELMISS